MLGFEVNFPHPPHRGGYFLTDTTPSAGRSLTLSWNVQGNWRTIARAFKVTWLTMRMAEGRLGIWQVRSVVDRHISPLAYDAVELVWVDATRADPLGGADVGARG